MSLRSITSLRVISRNLATKCTKAFATSSHSIHTPSSTPSPTPEQPKDNLHYHAFPNPPPGRFALSFLPDPPVSIQSKTILGFLPLSQDSVGLDDFRENPGFRETLHTIIKSGLVKNVSDTVDFEAASRGSDGYMHITDERKLPPAGRIGETEDLIGSVYVQDGKIVPDTYSPLPTYRLITLDGALQLPRGLDDHLLAELRKLDASERS